MSDTSSQFNRLSPAIRYQRDPTFHALVDTLGGMIASCDYTPTELREAVMLAAIRHEQRTVRHNIEVVVVKDSDLPNEWGEKFR